MRKSRNFITMAFIASLFLPGSAFAIMLDFTGDTLPIPVPNNSTSGSVFADPLGLGWALTVNTIGNADIRQNGAGLGVEGGGGAGINVGEWIEFLFNPYAQLTGFTIKSGNNAVAAYAVNITEVIGIELISGSPADINFAAAVTATSLTIESTSIGSGLPGNAFRVSALSFADSVGVPEPSILGLLGIGLLGLVGVRRMKKTV